MCDGFELNLSTGELRLFGMGSQREIAIVGVASYWPPQVYETHNAFAGFPLFLRKHLASSSCQTSKNPHIIKEFGGGVCLWRGLSVCPDERTL